MSEKGLKLLAATVAVLCALWVAVNFLPRGGSGAAGPSAALSSFFAGVTAESVTALRFQDPGEDGAVELKPRAGNWTVNGFAADSGAVARFWEAAEEAEVRDLVGSNPENHPRLGLSPDSAWTLSVETAEGSRTLLIGKSGTRYGTAYVRLPDEDEVYLLDGGLRPSITRSLEDWRNKRVARVDTSQVHRIEVERQGARSTLARSDSTLVLADGAPADGSTVRNLLGELARMDASGFYAQEDSLPAAAGSVRALNASGETLLLLEMGAGEGDRWVRVQGDSIVYRIASWRAGRVLPEAEDLRGEGS
jgi:hypothetical protein